MSTQSSGSRYPKRRRNVVGYQEIDQDVILPTDNEDDNDNVNESEAEDETYRPYATKVPFLMETRG